LICFIYSAADETLRQLKRKVPCQLTRKLRVQFPIKEEFLEGVI